ncbi:PilX N-terminal domain-containing pilus assembly protein [Planctomycetota bacterium]
MNNFFNDPRSPFHDPRRGIVLIVVLGVLALLSVLAITFVSLTRLERSISKNYVDRTKAIMLAESGIEKAIIKVQSWNGALHPDEMTDMAFNPSDPAASLKDATQPSFSVAQTPPAGINGAVSGFTGPGTYIPNGDFYKLKVQDESGKLNLNDSDNPMDPADPDSGRLSLIIENLAEVLYADRFGPGTGTVMSVKLEAARKTQGGRFASLQEVADVLREAGIKDISIPENAAETRRLQNLFLDNVTLWSWRDPNTIKPNPSFPASCDFKQDPMVFNYPDGGMRDVLPTETELDEWYGDDIYRASESQHQGLELAPRSPVNLNTASQELIQALLMGIQGTFVYEYGHERIYNHLPFYNLNRSGGSENAMVHYPLLYGGQPHPTHGAGLFPGQGVLEDEWGWYDIDWCYYRYSVPAPDERCHYFLDTNHPIQLALGNGFGGVRKTVAVDESLAQDLAQALFDRIHLDDPRTDSLPADGRPFGTWQEFQNFIRDYFNYYGIYNYDDESLNPSPWFNFYPYDTPHADSYRKFQADAIIANFCPNSDLNDFSPNATLHRFTDKNDLLHYTTEFCFEPTGVFSICSEGYVTGKDSNLQARQEIQTVIKVFETARITTQAQFFPEPPANMIENQPDYFGENISRIKTAGADSLVASSQALQGSLTQCYPEPLVPGNEGWLGEGYYDGCVMLATNQIEDILGGSPCFRASFDGSLDADDNDTLGEHCLMEDCDDPAWKDQTEHPTVNRLLFSSALASSFYDESGGESLKPGNLYVDGGYSEAYQTLMYHSINNFGSQNGLVGTMLFWVKPNWQPELSPRIRQLFTMSNFNDAVTFPWSFNLTPVSYFNDRKHSGELILRFTPRGAVYREDSGGYGDWYCDHEIIEENMHHGYSGSLPVQGKPDRSFIFGYGGGGMIGGRHRTVFTDTTNYVNRIDHDLDRDGRRDDNYTIPVYNFQAHRWSFFAVSWDTSQATQGWDMDLSKCSFLQINATITPVDHTASHTLGGQVGFGIWTNIRPILDGTIYGFHFNIWTGAGGPPYPSMQIAPVPEENAMRFGSYTRGMPNFAADATFDEIMIYPDSWNNLSPNFNINYQDGRYYNNVDEGNSYDNPATYTTGTLDLDILANLTGKSRFPVTRAALRSVSWTVWWPDTYLAPDPDGSFEPMSGILRDRNIDKIPSADMNPNNETDPYYPDRPDPIWRHVLDNNSQNGPNETWATDDNVKFDWDPMTVDIELPDGSWLFAGDSSYPKADKGETGISYAGGTKLSMLDGSLIRLTGDDGIRLRFFFNEKQESDKPLHDTPVLDDITITFIPGKPTVLLWQVIQ